MEVVDTKYKDLLSSVRHGNLAQFEQEMSRINEDEDYHPRNCTYVKTGDNLLHILCQLDRPTFLQALVSRFPNDLDLAVKNNEGKTPLHEAAQFGQLEVAEVLLKHKVNVDAIKRSDWTPLMLACTKRKLEMIGLLLTHGADLTLTNKDGWSPFHLAAREGSREALKLLYDHSVKVGMNKDELFLSQSKNGRCPLHTAALNGQLKAVEFIVEEMNLEPLFIKDSCGATPILDAARGGHLFVVKCLARADSSNTTSTVTDKMGRDCLDVAAQHGHLSLVDYFVDQMGMDPNHADKHDTMTALHWAAKEGQTTVVQQLMLKRNCSPFTVADGRTPLALAMGGGHLETVKLIMDNSNFTFDINVLPLAQTEPMKQLIANTLHQWNPSLVLHFA